MPSRLTSASSALACLMAASIPAAHAETRYAVTEVDIGLAELSFPQGINNSGRTVFNKVDGSFQAFGTVVDPPYTSPQFVTPLDGYAQSIVYDVNAEGRVVGYSVNDEPGPATPLSWLAGITSPVSGLPGNSFATAAGISDDGLIVGESNVDANPNSVTRVYTNDGGVVTDLGNLGGTIYFVQGVNNAGTAIGFGDDGTGIGARAFYSSGGSLVDIPMPPGPSLIFDITETGRVTGRAQNASGRVEAFVFDIGAGTTTWLGTEAGFEATSGLGINEAGVVVGYRSNLRPPATDGLIHDGAGWIALDTLLLPSEAGWDIDAAYDINDSGMILAQASFEGGPLVNVVLTPQRSDVCDGQRDDSCEARISFKPRRADQLEFQVTFTPTQPIDPAVVNLGLTLSNANGVIYAGQLLSGDLTPEARAWWFRDPTAAKGPGARDGLQIVRVKRLRDGISYRLDVTAHSESLGALATLPDMAIQLIVGNEAFEKAATWRELSNGWTVRLQ